MGCKGICDYYKAKSGGTQLRYVNGNARCQVCEIYIRLEGILCKPTGKYCKCCGNKIRSKPRLGRCKKAYESLQVIRI